jgi:D-alanyl-D-alanine carboxypeptidase (penicillin-binding protein 5/6)
MTVKKISLYTFLAIGILLISFIIFSDLSPLPPITTVAIFKPETIQNNQQISWAKFGSQAIGIVGYGVNNQSGTQIPSPIASTIKVLLAMSVLTKKPLTINQQGPNIIISQSDLANYNSDLALGESVVEVQPGETITEYQALQALLIASANNFAQILANWAFGSVSNYLVYANQYAKSLGMNATTVSDDSGYSTETVSNAVDLVTLGQKAISNPIIANIVSQYTTVIPVVGKILNYNTNLNPLLDNQINGIKTGNTTEGGGNYIYSGKYQGYQIVGSIVGANTLATSLAEGPKVLIAYEKLIKIQKIVTKDRIVGYYNLPWSHKIMIYSQNNLYLPVEPNIKYSVYLKLLPYHINQKNMVSNYLIIDDGQKINQYPLVIQNIYKSPSLWWKIKYNLKKID